MKINKRITTSKERIENEQTLDETVSIGNVRSVVLVVVQVQSLRSNDWSETIGDLVIQDWQSVDSALNERNVRLLTLQSRKKKLIMLNVLPLP